MEFAAERMRILQQTIGADPIVAKHAAQLAAVLAAAGGNTGRV